MSIRSRVRAGAKFLTSVYGEAWKKKVRIEDLEMRSPTSCILGQTDSDYTGHRKTLELTTKYARELGFEVMVDSSDADEEYEQLTNEWITLLKEK